METNNLFSNISNFYKDHKLIINITLIISLVIFFIIAVRSCNDRETSLDNLKIANDSLNMKIVEYTDKNNITHAQIQQLELTNSELNSLNTNLSLHYLNQIDSFSKILKVNAQNIQEYTKIITKAQGEGKGEVTSILIHDTIKGQTDTSFEIKSNDGFLKYNGIIDKNQFGYNYEYYDTLNIVKFYKKAGFLNLRHDYYLDVSNKNPNATISGLEQFSKAPLNKYKHFSLIVGTSYGFDSKFNPQWFPVTITFGYRLFDF